MVSKRRQQFMMSDQQTWHFSFFFFYRTKRWNISAGPPVWLCDMFLFPAVIYLPGCVETEIVLMVGNALVWFFSVRVSFTQMALQIEITLSEREKKQWHYCIYINMFQNRLRFNNIRATMRQCSHLSPCPHHQQTDTHSCLTLITR